MWTGGLVLTGAPVVWRTLRGIASGRFAADLVAMLAIVAALPLAQPLAGLIVVLMQTGGEALERYAEGRASEAVRALEAAAPRIAHRVRAGEDRGDPGRRRGRRRRAPGPARRDGAVRRNRARRALARGRLPADR